MAIRPLVLGDWRSLGGSAFTKSLSRRWKSSDDVFRLQDLDASVSGVLKTAAAKSCFSVLVASVSTSGRGSGGGGDGACG